MEGKAPLLSSEVFKYHSGALRLSQSPWVCLKDPHSTDSQVLFSPRFPVLIALPQARGQPSCDETLSQTRKGGKQDGNENQKAPNPAKLQLQFRKKAQGRSCCSGLQHISTSC